MGIFDKKKDEPDFTNVHAGGSPADSTNVHGGGAPADFTNVRGGGSSTALPPMPGVTRQEGPAPTAVPPIGDHYVVVSGDSLSKIAKHFYGDAKAWNRIYEANRTIIKDPDLIFPGQKLTIPPK